MNFDEIIDRRNTHSSKWDNMEQLYGISQDDGIAMWVADTDFRPPACVQNAVEKMHGHGIYGYYGDDRSYYEAICWWMKTRHNWEIDPTCGGFSSTSKSPRNSCDLLVDENPPQLGD